jgi:glycosyltransferase involved in cell wall biosynthesis
MRALLIYNKFPYPITDGGTIASDSLTRTLCDIGLALDLFAFSTPKHPAAANAVPSDLASKLKLTICDVDTHVSIPKVVKSLFRKTAIHADRIKSPFALKKLKEQLTSTSYDFVILDGLFALAFTDFIAQNSRAKIIYRAHNLEYKVWALNAKSTSNPLKKWYFSFISRRLKALEKHSFSQCHQVWTITDTDKAEVMGLAPHANVTVVPVAISFHQKLDTPTFQPNTKSIHYFHLGAMNWIPNADAMEFYINEIHPELKRLGNDYQFSMAGRYMPARFFNFQDTHIKVKGEVGSFEEFAIGKTAFVVPLRSGSGIRIKILEAMSLGIPVISTKIGAEGIAYTDGKNILIANSPADFYRISKEILESKIHLEEIGKAGQKLVMENYSFTVVNERVKQLLLL